MRNLYKNKLTLALATALTVGAPMAMAGGGGANYGNILSGLDGDAAVTAFIAAATILAVVGFGKWISKKIGRFFG